MQSASGTRPGANPETKPVLAVIVLVITVAVLVGGGWMLWSAVAGPSESGELDVGTIPDRYRPFANRPAPAPRANLNKDGINPAGIGFYRVQNGEFFMVLASSETSFAPVKLQCSRAQLITPEQRQLLALCAESANAGSAKIIGLTPDQVKKLTEIRRTSAAGMKLENADREKLRNLWKAWITTKEPAAKKSAEAPLLAAVKEIGTRAMEPTKQQYAELAVKVRAIVSDEQFAKYRQLRAQ